MHVYDLSRKVGLTAQFADQELCRQWQLPERTMTIKDAWSLLIERVSTSLDRQTLDVLHHILEQGALSERLQRLGGNTPSHAKLVSIYQELGNCLEQNQQLGA